MLTNCTIGIPAYNEEQTLPVLLESLNQQVFPATCTFHVIVVANGCTDHTLEAALTFGTTNLGQAHCTQQDEKKWWHFHGSAYDYSVCESPLAGKSSAVNLIHATAEGGIVLLFDADISLGPGVIAAMCQTLLTHPEHGAVSVKYTGVFPPLNPAQSLPLEWCRLVTEQALNTFDQYRPRLDGKCCGYYHDLIQEHPCLQSADIWIEGMACQHSAGCLYLTDVCIRYRFPQSFAELEKQYIRYARTTEVFVRTYPNLLPLILNNRKKYRVSTRGSHFFMALVIGQLFLYWIRFRARSHEYPSIDKWEPISSTKTW